MAARRKSNFCIDIHHAPLHTRSYGLLLAASRISRAQLICILVVEGGVLVPAKAISGGWRVNLGDAALKIGSSCTLDAGRNSLLRGTALALVGVSLLAGCAAFPEDGPSGRSVQGRALVHQRLSEHQHYALVDVDFRVISAIAAHPSQPLSSLTAIPSNVPTDLIGPGDVLAVSVYQPGMGLSASADHSGGGGGETYPHLAVDRAGAVEIPYAGLVRVADLTTEQAASSIRRALIGRAVNPQVLVWSVSSARNSITILGDVHSPGRVPVAPNANRLTDVIAAVGGPTAPPSELSVTVVRGSQRATIPLTLLLAEPGEDIQLGPLDQVRVTSLNRRVNIFGAVGKSSQIALDGTTASLADTLSKIGGLDNNSSDARSALLFRFERPAVAAALGVKVDSEDPTRGVPIVYRVDLRDPQGFFIATKFGVEADDLIFVPRADLSEAEKFFNAVDLAAQFLYDASVTKSLGL